MKSASLVRLRRSTANVGGQAFDGALLSTFLGRAADRLSAYAIAGFDPEFVLDFVQQTYRVNSSAAALADAVTFSRAGNATMVDSDGLMKWAPHNLAWPSDNFASGFSYDNATVSGANEIVEDATAATDHAINPTNGYTFFAGVTYTFEMSVKRGTGTRNFNMRSGNGNILDFAGAEDVIVDLSDGTLLNGAAGDSVIVDPDDSSFWRVIATRVCGQTGGTFVRPGLADGTSATYDGDGVSSIIVRRISWYRSDLGGMVNNPATGTSYVPTTDAPVYLPRVGHHVWNAGQWFIANVSNGVDPDQQVLVEFSTTDDGDGTVSASGTVTGATLTGTLTYTVHSELTARGTLLTWGVRDGDLTLNADGSWSYSGSEWVNEGLLIESESRTNQETQSVSLANYSANKVGVTITTGQTDRRGGSNAGLIVLTGATAYTFGVLFTNGGVKTFAVDLKAGTKSKVSVQIGAGGLGEGVRAQVDLSIGTITAPAVIGGSYTAVASKIEPLGDGWYRASVTANVPVTTHVGYVCFPVGGAYAESNTAGDTVLFAYPQLEPGSTPSSIIPTNGSAVIRAAETMYGPAANMPWPVPNVIGPELVENGTFDADVSGWTQHGSGAFTWDASGAIACSDVGGADCNAQANITTVAGKVYLFEWEVKSSTGGWLARIRNGTDYTSGYRVGGIGTHTAIFVASVTGTNTVNLLAADTDSTTVFDNISVREIDPLALTIQMDGRMTYADTENGSEVIFNNWFASSVNFIQTRLNTLASRTGVVDFYQRESASGQDVVSGLTNQYSPGVLVPFNIASRHGSTFINGAIDGVALTADATPTALPDLRTTDFQIAPTFMGTIRTLRVWANDLGDTGIEEASA